MLARRRFDVRVRSGRVRISRAWPESACGVESACAEDEGSADDSGVQSRCCRWNRPRQLIQSPQKRGVCEVIRVRRVLWLAKAEIDAASPSRRSGALRLADPVPVGGCAAAAGGAARSRGQRMRARRQSPHSARGARPVSSCSTSSGNARDRLAQHLEDRRRAGQRVVENTIQQVLDRPRELAELARADHASAALEGVERAAHGDERLALHGILIPCREVALDLGQLFVSFLDEEFHELRIGVLRRRSADGRRPRARDVGGHGRARQVAPGSPTSMIVPPTVRDLHRLRKRGGLQRRHRWHRGCLCLLERLHAGLRVVEHVPGIAAPGLQRLHVVLDTDNRIGEPVHEARRQRACRPAASHASTASVTPSMTSTARVLPSISSPAFMPRISSCQLSRPAASSVPPTF